MNYKYEYAINNGTSPHYKVFADTYSFGDGYFHFFDANKSKVFSIRAERVATIQRTDSSK